MAIDLTGLSLGNFWEWLKENKVGAWIGGIWSVISFVWWGFRCIGRCYGQEVIL